MPDRFQNPIDVVEQSGSPSAPSPGYGRFYPKSDGKPYFKNSAGDEVDLGVAFIKTTATLTVVNWSLVSGLYEQSVSNANITAASVVDVIPNNEDIAIVKAADFMPQTDSASGSVKVYCTNLPTDAIGVSLTIWK